MTSRARPTVTRRLRGARALILSGALGLVTGASGCGSDAANPADDFAGTWRYTDYISLVQCPKADPMSQPPEPNKTFAHGVDGGLVDLSPNPLLTNVFCDFAFDVAGPVATVQAGQTCELTSLDTLTVDQPAGSPPQWTFTLNSPTTAEEVVGATAHFSLAGAISTCSWSLKGHLQRISKD